MSPRRSSVAARAQTRALAQRSGEVVESLMPETRAPETPHGAPAVALLMGFPGSGKTHCARLLADRLQAAHVASDALRSRLFVAASYASEENAAVFKIVEGLVERLLLGRHRVIVDATNLRASSRAATLALAKRLEVPCACVLVTSEESAVLERLAERRRARADHDRSDADERVYLAMRERGFEPPEEPYSIIRNGPGLAAEIDRVVAELEARWSAT